MECIHIVHSHTYTHAYIHIYIYTCKERRSRRRKSEDFLLYFFARARKDDAAKGVGHSLDHFQTRGRVKGGVEEGAFPPRNIARRVLRNVVRVKMIEREEGVEWAEIRMGGDKERSGDVSWRRESILDRDVGWVRGWWAIERVLV